MRAQVINNFCPSGNGEYISTALEVSKFILYFIAFPTTYLTESGFSRVIYLLSKACNRFNIVNRVFVCR